MRTDDEVDGGRPARAGAAPGLRSWWLLPLFLLHALPFASRPALIGGDEVHYALLAHSIGVGGDFDPRDDYAAVARGSKAAGVKRAGQVLDPHVRPVGDREIPAHPVGLPMLLAPLVRLQQAASPGSAPDLLLLGTTLALTFGALVAGWRALAAHLGSESVAAAWVFGGYFSTPLWFYSRTLFTEPYTWAFAVLALAAIGAGRVALASLCLGLTLLTKETALLLVLPVLLGAFLRTGARRTVPLLAGPALAAGWYAARNLALGLPLLTTSQPFQLGDLVAGAAGLLVDARHGLLSFAPLLAIGALAGLAGTRGPREVGVPAWLAGAVFAGYFLLDAAWIDWRGGSCYGPRLLVPALPALILLAAGSRPSGAVLRYALGAAFCAGFTVSWCAALAPWRAFWGATPLELVRARPFGAAAGALAAVGLVIAAQRRLRAAAAAEGRARLPVRAQGAGGRPAAGRGAAPPDPSSRGSLLSAGQAGDHRPRVRPA